jgi:DNA-binding transcriptional LysR family regulator
MQTDTLTLRAFARVARLGNFAAAARELRLSTTAVSRRVAALEEQLGARLLHRTTRRTSLTQAGELALERVERVLDDLVELEDAVGGSASPSGHLRITSGVSVGLSFLHGILPDFLRQYPNISVEVVETDEHVDLVQRRIDLALRVGTLADSGLIARRLAAVPHHICASPAWLNTRAPLDAARLDELPRIIDTNQPAIWRLSGPDGRVVELPAQGRLAVNSAHGVRDACLASMGLAMLPGFVVASDLQRGLLVDALPGWRGPEIGLYVVVLERRWISRAVRALMAHVEAAADTMLNVDKQR